MRITIYQPQYFPRLHYFNRIFNVDMFVLLSSAQYTKAMEHISKGQKIRRKTYQSDTPIKFTNGIYFLTTPIRHNGLQQLNKTTISYSQNWQQKHLMTIKTYYSKSEYFHDVFPSLQDLLSVNYASLAELNIQTIIWSILRLLEIPFQTDEVTLDALNDILAERNTFRLKKIIEDKDTEVARPEGFHKGTEWTTAICLKLGATEYYHGGTALHSYMDIDYYKKYHITPIEQQWTGKEYTQLFRENARFIQNLSIIDLLCNVSPKEARNILEIEQTVARYSFNTTKHRSAGN